MIARLSFASLLALAAISSSFAARADEEKKQPPAGTEAADKDAQPTPAADGASAPTEVTIEGEKPASNAASEIEVGRRELELRPRLRPGDIVEALPGAFAVQHAGGGKANQYFLRGFDADHGTDIAFSVDGVPINMVSHGHGQGFSDLHFLIPELVVGLDGSKGSYYANQGDFATAGAINFKLAEKFDESYAQYSIGQYGIMRGLVIESPDLGDDWRLVTAAELYKDDGPFVNPEQLKRLNFYFRLTHDVNKTDKISATWMSYGSSWYGSGQIPARAVCGEGESQNLSPQDYGQPCIDHFGYVDPTEGGMTQRHMASLAYQHLLPDGDGELNAMAYLEKYRFTLYSDFTFFAEDPIHGDEIEQDDDRTLGGLDVSYKHHVHYEGAKFTTTMGAQVRVDGIENALYHDEARVRIGTKQHDQISESEIGLYAEEDVRLRKWIRLVFGARVERVDVDVDDLFHTPTTDPTLGANESGFKGAMQFLPKAQAILSPIPQLDLFLDWGRGFHSNDARGVVQQGSPATLLVPATGWEVGMRVKPVPNLMFSVTGFLMDLQSELVWNGDDGGTEPSGQTRRYGLELSGRYHISNWLFADADATFDRAVYTGEASNGANAVALAPTRTFTAGIGARPTFGPWTPFADARIKVLGDRPADPAGEFIAQGFTTVDANVGVRYGHVELGCDAQNLFDQTYREVTFVTTSRLPYEPAPVTGVHYSPGWPRTVIGRAALYW